MNPSTEGVRKCRDCAYYRGWLRTPECGHPRNNKGVNYVSGKPEPLWLTAQYCRENSCGHEGNWFERRVPLWLRLVQAMAR